MKLVSVSLDAGTFLLYKKSRKVLVGNKNMFLFPDPWIRNKNVQWMLAFEFDKLLDIFA